MRIVDATDLQPGDVFRFRNQGLTRVARKVERVTHPLGIPAVRVTTDRGTVVHFSTSAQVVVVG